MNNDSPRFCPECEHVSTRHMEHREEMHRVRGETIVVSADVAVCDHCNADAEHDALLQSLQDDQAMYHFMEEHQDRLSPWERRRARQ